MNTEPQAIILSVPYQLSDVLAIRMISVRHVIPKD